MERILSVIKKKKDQSTSTCCEEVLEVLSGDSPYVQTDTDTASVISTHSVSIISNPNAVVIAMEDNSLELNSDSSDLHVCSRQQSTSRFQPH